MVLLSVDQTDFLNTLKMQHGVESTVAAEDLKMLQVINLQ